MHDRGPRSDTGLQPGAVLAGKYRVERVLGAGGMGVVVAAHHIQLDTRVALKFLRPEMLSNPEAVARFVREGRAAVKFSSEHVARVLDVGELQSGAPYIVMEYLEGGDLATWLRQRGPLTVEQAVEFVVHACVAVAEAHGLCIVHRDLKPANLFCVRRPDGQLYVKVLDFGISKASDPTTTGVAMTKTSAIMGSPLYMSPEQMHSTRDVDTQTDIWALGVILYELMAGRVPFDGETTTEIAVKVVMQAPPPLRAFRADVPPQLEAVVMRCLEKDKRNRFANVAELALALAPFAPKRARESIGRIAGTIQAAGMSVSELSMPPSAPVPRAGAASGTIAPVGTTTPGGSRALRKAAVFASVLAAAMLVAAAATVLVHSRPAVTIGPTLTSSSPAPGVSTPTGDVPASDADLSPPQPQVSVSTAPKASPPAAVRSVSVSHPPAAPAGSTVTPVDCNPPFTVDEQGRQHFKPECYK